MPSFSTRSEARLQTCHQDLQRLFHRVVQTYDCTMLEGHRGMEAQDAAFEAGHSRVRWPNGNHNKLPSLAVDVAPCDSRGRMVAWSDLHAFYHFAGFVQGVAEEMGIPIRSGLDWDGDRELDDQTLIDGPHFELIE